MPKELKESSRTFSPARRGMIATLALALAFSAASQAALGVSTVDLTQPNGLESKYVVGLGRVFSDTVINGKAPMGLVDISLGRGNGGPWWELNDGNASLAQNLNSFAATSIAGDDFLGYMFKAPVTNLTTIQWTNRAFADGGTFDSQPRVEVLDAPVADGGVWSTLAVTFDTPYDRSLGVNSLRTYNIMPASPVSGTIWGVRIIGAPNNDNAPGGDPDGFIASTELKLTGAIDLQINFSTNLALQSNGGTAIINQAQTGQPGNINDGNLLTREQTFGAGTTPLDFVGVTWATPKDQVAAVGITFKRFGDGGLFDPDNLPDVEFTTDGSTWQSVSGLDLMRYGEIATAMIDFATPPGVTFPPEQSFLFTFDPVSGIRGIRAIGAPEGTVDGNGFLGVFEFEVFQATVPEPASALLAMLGGAALLGRRRRTA